MMMIMRHDYDDDGGDDDEYSDSTYSYNGQCSSDQEWRERCICVFASPIAILVFDVEKHEVLCTYLEWKKRGFSYNCHKGDGDRIFDCKFDDDG